jgi:hypothetical protein
MGDALPTGTRAATLEEFAFPAPLPDASNAFLATARLLINVFFFTLITFSDSEFDLLSPSSLS